MKNTAYTKKVIGLGFFLCAIIVIAILKGSVDIPFHELFSEENRPILLLRLSRILMAAVAGCGLSVSGVVLQSILRNPLADPYLLGTSSGAGLGAILALLIGISRLYMPLAAFLGALASMVIVFSLASNNNKIAEQSLVLSGVVVSVALSAIIIFLISVSGNQTLQGMTWWLWGSFQVSDPLLLLIVSIITGIGITFVYVFSQDLNAMSIGTEEAVHVGIDVEKIKKILIAAASLITASIVCLCGIIGFVGLVIPHMVRLVVGPNHKRLIPAACLASTAFMIICDIISRIAFAPIEVPIGVITSLLGTPVFMLLLKRSQKRL